MSYRIRKGRDGKEKYLFYCRVHANRIVYFKSKTFLNLLEGEEWFEETQKNMLEKYGAKKKKPFNVNVYHRVSKLEERVEGVIMQLEIILDLIKSK